MLARFRAVLLTSLTLACGSASQAPVKPAPTTAAPLPKKTDAPPPRLRLDGDTLEVLGTGSRPLGDELLLPSQPNRENPVPFELEFGPKTSTRQLHDLLRLAARAGWPMAQLANQDPAVYLRLAHTSTVPPTQELPTLLLWPKLMHAGKVAAPDSSTPVDGLRHTTFPYGTNAQLASTCDAHTCSQIRVHASPDTPLRELRDALTQVTLANRGAIEVLVLSGRMPPPGKPALRAGHSPVKGRLPPVVIQRVVRATYANFRACYDDGLSRNPELTGRVTVRFVIDREGNVASVSTVPTATDMPDEEVTGCVLKHYQELKFPKPEGGVVTVEYPILFSPSAD